MSLVALLFLFAAGICTLGQNQVPPGLRKPPFIVVPPANEPPGAASERVDVFANQPPVVALPPQTNQPQSVFVPPQGHQPPPSVVVPPQQGSVPFPSAPAPPPNDEIALSPEHIKLVEQTLDRTCLNCLCQASTKCEKTDCFLTGPEQYYCGPYQISFAYWADSGKPGDNPNDAHAFEKCLKNKPCAERSIFSYMIKYARDCNGDGVFDCQDIALIHKGGPHNCNGEWIFNTEYWRRFGSCWGGAPVDLRSGQQFRKI